MVGAIHFGECPHCGNNHVQFTGWAISRSNAMRRGGGSWNVYMSCNGCKGPIALVVESCMGEPWNEHDPVVIPDHIGSMEVLAMYPRPVKDLAPDDVPQRIAAAFLEARDNFKRGRWETCEMLCGKALDLATQRLKPGFNNFSARINALRDDGTITPAMADWAHIVRDERNGSVHTEEPASEQEARELTDFAEMFLLYAFTLPAMVEQRRQAK